MNVIYISYDGMTDPLGQSQVIPYLIGLSHKGHLITLISCEKKQRFNTYKKEIEKLLNDNNIKWIPLNYTSKPPVLSTIYDILKIRKTLLKLIKNFKYDIIHCRSYISALIGLEMKVKYGYGFVFDMRGFYADERVDGALWNLKNPLYKWIFQYFKNKEKQFLTKADYIVSLTENAKNEIHSWKYLQGQHLPIEVIPCCADMRHFNIANIDFIKQKELIKLLKLEHIDIILSYLGSFGTWYLPIEMFTFFKRILAVYPKSKFLILSPDTEEDIIKIANSCGLSKDYLIIKYAKRSEVPLYLSLSNLSIFFIKPTFSKKASSPTKQGETMALGIPVITNAGIGDTDMILNATSTGYVINDFNDSNYEKAVLAIDSLLKIPKEQIIEAANKFYSLEKGIEKYNSIYNKVK